MKGLYSNETRTISFESRGIKNPSTDPEPHRETKAIETADPGKLGTTVIQGCWVCKAHRAKDLMWNPPKIHRSHPLSFQIIIVANLLGIVASSTELIPTAA